MSQYRRLLDRGLDVLESALRESLGEEAAAGVAQLVGELMRISDQRERLDR